MTFSKSTYITTYKMHLHVYVTFLRTCLKVVSYAYLSSKRFFFTLTYIKHNGTQPRNL